MIPSSVAKECAAPSPVMSSNVKIFMRRIVRHITREVKLGYSEPVNLRANSTTKFGSFAKLEALIVPRLIKATEAATSAVLEVSQDLCPVRSGDLRSTARNTVEWSGTRVQGYVFYTAPYAAFVEFGTGLTGRGTYPYNLPLAGVPFTGSWVYDYKQQNWVGMESRPFLRPALDTARPRILAAFNEALGL